MQVAESVRLLAKDLPLKPGVYQFVNDKDEVLYVGKATRLRERVRSYFADDLAESRGPGIVSMVLQAVSLRHIETESELEALLLEARLIRQLKPKYNVKLRDDKSFSLIRIDHSEVFPGIYLSREKDLEELLEKRKRARTDARVSQVIDAQEFFGPYLSAKSVRQALASIRRIWPFRDCTSTKFANYERLGYGCVLATLGLCSAPCAGKITPDSYKKNIAQIRAFLNGDRRQVLTMIEADMAHAAEDERFEEAAILRDRLQALIHLQTVAQTRKQSRAKEVGEIIFDPETDLRVECVDISHNQGAYTVASLVTGMIRRGKVDEVHGREEIRKRFRLDPTRQKKYKIQTVEGVSDVAAIAEVVRRRVTRGLKNEAGWELPDLLILDGGITQLGAASEVRTALKAEEKVAVAAVAKGPTRRKVDRRGEWQVLQNLNDEAQDLLAELMREEAHRVAISFYRNTHSRGLLSRA